MHGSDSKYVIVAEYPHDTRAFTQGLFVDPRDSDYFFEGKPCLSFLSCVSNFKIGTGMVGSSQLRRVEISTGRVVNQYAIDSKHFGEGICIVRGTLYQLTWQDRAIYRYQLQENSEGYFVNLPPLSLRQPPEFNEGWGLTTDGDYLILSDGTSNLYFLSERSSQNNAFQLYVVRKVVVKFKGQPVPRLNELEWINGEIWANVWMTNFVVIINPANGEVIRRLNLVGLKSTGDVLNGIAYDKEKDAIYVTGKYWPKVFRIQEVISTP